MDNETRRDQLRVREIQRLLQKAILEASQLEAASAPIQRNILQSLAAADASTRLIPNRCQHSDCSNHYIETGDPSCIK